MDKKRALGQVKRMIVSSPSMPDLYNRLACDFIRSGKHAEALRTVESQFHLENSLNSLYSTAMAVCLAKGDQSNHRKYRKKFLESVLQLSVNHELYSIRDCSILNIDRLHTDLFEVSSFQSNDDANSNDKATSELLILAGYTASGKSTIVNLFWRDVGDFFSSLSRPLLIDKPGVEIINSLRLIDEFIGKTQGLKLFRGLRFCPYISNINQHEEVYSCCAIAPKRLLFHLDLRTLMMGTEFAESQNLKLHSGDYSGFSNYFSDIMKSFWTHPFFANFDSVRVSTKLLGIGENRERYDCRGDSHDFFVGQDDSIFDMVHKHWFQGLKLDAAYLPIVADNIIQESEYKYIISRRRC